MIMEETKEVKEKDISNEDLLKLFNVEGEDISEDFTSSRIPIENLSKTLLVHDEFSLRKGRENSVLIKHDAEGKEVKVELDPYKVADIRHSIFSAEPELEVKQYVDPIFKEFFESFIETQDYKDAHEGAMGNNELTDLVSPIVYKRWYKIVEEIQKKHPEYTGVIDDAKKDAGEDDFPKLSLPDRMKVISEGAKAGKHVSEEIEDRKERSSRDHDRMSHGMRGLGDTSSHSITSMEKMSEFYKQLKKNKKLLDIMQTAGKMKSIAVGLQKERFSGIPNEMTDINLAGKIENFLPSELLALFDDDLGAYQMSRFIENQILSREWKGYLPSGKGPIILVIDESGSMGGIKEQYSKALALTLAYIATRQRRWCGLIAYSGGGSGHRMLTLKPGLSNELIILNWMKPFISGGSNRDVPIVEMPEFYKQLNAPKGKTDLVFITDAECYLKDSEVKDFKKWKAEAEAKVVSFVIQSTGETLKGISDVIYERFIPKVDDESMMHSKELKEVLSVG